MATVILGGLVTSPLLNVLVLPTLALRYGRFEPGQALSQTEQYRDCQSLTRFGRSLEIAFESSAEGELIDKLFTVL
jgi:hypothetical protein